MFYTRLLGVRKTPDYGMTRTSSARDDGFLTIPVTGQLHHRPTSFLM